MGQTTSLISQNISFEGTNPDNRPRIVVGEPVRADGFFGWSDGLHTVSFHVSYNFNGRIYLEGTLALKPVEKTKIATEEDVSCGLAAKIGDKIITETDWFPILIGGNAQPYITFPGNPAGTNNSTAAQTKAVTFIGNFAYLRYRITDATAGSVIKMLLNH